MCIMVPYQMGFTERYKVVRNTESGLILSDV